jgi:predicted RNase H-like nuclease (RuvC/YqgF family)
VKKGRTFLFLTTVVWLLGATLLGAASPGRADERKHMEARQTERKPAHVYTNEDLERVHPFRDETGASSTPAVPHRPDEAAAPSPRRRRRHGTTTHDEAYWRGEARKLRERVRALSEKREALRERLAERREARGRVLRPARSSSNAAAQSDRAIERRIAALERRMRGLEEDLEERARREGALPGWLR